MRKIAMSLAVIMVLLLPMTAHAATPRSIGITPRITFSGTTANCSVIITSNSGDDEIEATIKLWKGSTCVATWPENGTGYIIFSDTATVTKGKTYTLTVDAIVNDVAQPQAYVSAKCE